jgi:tetraacyldisaccharide 4'-kinase
VGKYIPLDIKKFNKDINYLVFSGIGNHESFISMLKEYKLNIIKDIEFPDHYKYKSYDIDKILKLSKDLNCQIITTEKDYFRLNNEKIDNINFIRSELKILDEEKLISTILKINENN